MSFKNFSEAKDLLRRALTLLLTLDAATAFPPPFPFPFPFPQDRDPEDISLPTRIRSDTAAPPPNVIEATELIYQSFAYIGQPGIAITDLVSGVLDSLSIIKYGVYDAAYGVLNLQGYQDALIAIAIAMSGNQLPPTLNQTAQDYLSTSYKDTRAREAKLVDFRAQIDQAMKDGVLQQQASSVFGIVGNAAFSAGYAAEALKGKEEIAAGNRATIIAVRKLIIALEELENKTAAPQAPSQQEECVEAASVLGHPNLIVCYSWQLVESNSSDFANQEVVMYFKLPNVFLQSNITRVNGRKLISPFTGSFNLQYDFPDNMTSCSSLPITGCNPLVTVDVTGAQTVRLGTFLYQVVNERELLTELGGAEKVFEKQVTAESKWPNHSV